MKHSIKRKTFTWNANSRGKDCYLTLDKISDSHLLHIIGWILYHSNRYSVDTLQTFLKEAEYRSKNHIFIKNEEF